MTTAESYRQHLACLASISGSHCTVCNRAVPDDEVVTREAEYGWRHIPCGRLTEARNGRPYCEGLNCNYYPDPAEMRPSDPLSADG